MDSAPASFRLFIGFTLIEVMAVVAIVALLLVVALPTYQGQMARTYRAAAQAEMLRIASMQQQHLLASRAYLDVEGLAATGFALRGDVARHYNYDILLGDTRTPEFQLIFSPHGSQRADGVLTLNEQGTGTPAEKWP